jgi:DNA-binding NarL/FixJ family response regulator
MAVAIAADDSVLVRAGSRVSWPPKPGIEVVVSCGDLSSLLEAVESQRPDVDRGTTPSAAT